MARQPWPIGPESPRGLVNQVAPQGSRWAGRWYFVVTIATAGMFAWVPFVHAARRLGKSTVARLAWIYGGIDALLCVLIATTPQNSHGQAIGADGKAMSTVAGLLALGVVIFACIQQAPLRRMVYEGAPTEPQSPPIDPAVQAVLAARARRDEARHMATDDPALARELHIGRPDLAGSYDDGGLVDLNSAPAALIAEICDIPAEAATEVVEARTARGMPFANVDELLVMVDLPVGAWDRIRDRAVLIP